MLKAFAAGRLFGEPVGSDPFTVLALHGWMRTHRDFAAVLDGMDALALDLPGFGASPPPPAAWGAAGYAAAVAPLLDPRTPVVVIGHSFGGRVAVHLAATWPDRVRGVVLTGVPNLVRRSAGSARRPPLGFRLAKVLNRRGLLSDGRMEAEKKRHGSADYRAAEGVVRDVLVTVVNETYEEQLRAIPSPVELVWGDDDDQAPLDVARAAEQLLAHARLTVVPGAGHQTPATAPGELRAAVERLL